MFVPTCYRSNHLSDSELVLFKPLFQIPLPKDNRELDMSRWFQNLIAVIQLDIDYSTKSPLSKQSVFFFY